MSPTFRRLIRSYGLVILLALAFLLMALLVREPDRTVPVQGSGYDAKLLPAVKVV